jgi:hypothetical protein
VFVTYEGRGAGTISQAGVPGVARFLKVEVPNETRLGLHSSLPLTRACAKKIPKTSNRSQVRRRNQITEPVRSIDLLARSMSAQFGP